MSGRARAPRLQHRVSRHVVSHRLTSERYAIWNALFPSVLVIAVPTWDAVRSQAVALSDLSRQTRADLLEHRILFEGDVDPYEAEFFASAERALATLDRKAEEFYRDRLPYRTLALVNSGCNLGCSYCVSYKGDEFRADAARVADRGEARVAAIRNVIDQFMTSKVRWGDEHATLAFNGGEILLRWSMIEPLIRYMRTTYPSVKLHCDMNTNATLITDTVARSLAELEVEINVSIDGYREAHNSTRKYHVAGRTSFDDVIGGITRYNEHSPDQHKVRGFQGTIENVDSFELEKLFGMIEMGFDVARLAPNLLGKDGEYGERAARWEAEMVVASQSRDLTASHTYFEHVYKKLGRDAKGFTFHCNGLQGVAARILTLNIDSMQVSQLCSFSSPGSIPLADANYDIYDPVVWRTARRYIVERIDMLRKECQGCDVLGVCQGACVNNGVTLANKLNAASCNYQRQTWRHAIDYAFDGTLRPAETGPDREAVDQGGPVRLQTEAGGQAPVAGATREGPSGSRVWALTPVS